jgi:hypothetical protein
MAERADRRKGPPARHPAPSKSVPLSVRVSPDDADFIARTDIAGASTPSDKVRALLAEARKRREGFSDYSSCLGMVQEMLAPTFARLRAAEHRERVHSELVLELTQWMPEALAFLLTGLDDESQERSDLEAFEEGVAERLFRLIENVIRMNVTHECRGYDPAVVARRMGPVVELVTVIQSREVAA